MRGEKLVPELPEVETVKRMLAKQVINKQIIGSRIMFNKIIKEPAIDQFQLLIKGQTIRAMKRRAKYLIFVLDDYVLISHLRMEGKYFLQPKHSDIDWKHILLALEFADGTELLYHDTRRFGTFNLQPINNYMHQKPLNQLGLEPFDASLTAEYLQTAWQKRSVAVKTALLEQKIMVGIGNIYANEILFLCGLHPCVPVSHLDKTYLTKIILNTQKVLKAAIASGGTTIFSFESAPGIDGKFTQYLKVHGRKGLHCFVCHSVIEKIKVGQRGTYYCPVCQIWP